MSRHLAVIENGVVSNVILADVWPGAIDVTGITPRPSPGWLYDGKTFVRPEPTAPVVQTTARMTHYAFLRRLSIEEHVAIELAMPNDPLLRVAKQRFDAAQNVDVSNAETQQFVGYLAQQGIISVDRMSSLLSPVPVTDEGAVQ